MAQYRKKPVVIDAFPVREALRMAERDWYALPDWLIAGYEKAEGGHVVFGSDHVSITTLEGTMRAERDDWIIRGVQGELYPCKPDIFAATYEPVVDHRGTPDPEPEVEG